jgi:periplasmic copper chaperone A
MSRASLTAIAAVAFFATIPPVFAHVELETSKAAAGGAYKAVLMVPHGCAGSTTIGLRVQIPDGVIAVKPMPKPGWKIATVTQKLAPPIEVEGDKITQSVREIDWSGGNLPDSFYDEFVFVAQLPDKPGTVLYFPAVQRCAKGVTRWIDIPAQGQSSEDLKEPAPALTLGPKAAGGD